MDLVTAAAAKTATPALEAAAEAVKESKAASLLAEGREAIGEIMEAALSDKGLLEQLGTIKHGSFESLAARNEARAAREVSQVETNRTSGAAREEAVREDLERDFPTEDGYRIERVSTPKR